MDVRRWVTRTQEYSKQAFTSDLTAGAIVGIVALPLCVAFAIASGVTPEKGIITGVVASLLIALFSGSRVQIGGPSGPFVVIAATVVAQYGITGLMVATFTAGVMLVIMGRAKLGELIKFIPYPVIAGFTAGVAILLVTTEFKDLLGLDSGIPGNSILSKWYIYLIALDTINPWAVLIAALTIFLQGFQPRWLGKIPGSLAALIIATVAVAYFKLPVETIGSRFVKIGSGFPMPMFPQLSWDVIHDMMQPAMAIALLAAIESLLSAVVADGMTGTTHDPNQVLVAQGFANIGSSFFGGLPAVAAIARTATNVRNGGRTPVAGITHAVLLLLILLFFGRWASRIPLSCLAAILGVVAYNLLDWRAMAALLKNPKSDVAVLLTTLGLTIFIDLTTGVLIGMALAGALFIKRMAAVTDVAVVSRAMAVSESSSSDTALLLATLPRGVEIYEINGPFFFGAVYKLREALKGVKKPRVRMIRMSKVNVMDSTGLHALEEVWNLCRKEGSVLLISEIHAQPFTALLKSGLLEKFGEANVLASFDEAVVRAAELTGEPARQKHPA